jgi:DNA replication protein DnaC
VSTTSELTHLFRALKAPAAARALPKLADRARTEDWSYERFAEALLQTEHASREAHGGEGRIKAARFPARKTLEEFDFTFQRSVKKTVVEVRKWKRPRGVHKMCSRPAHMTSSMPSARSMTGNVGFLPLS